MRIVIAGGTGFIGSALARRLSAKSPVVLSRLSDLAVLREADVVFNCAGTEGAVESNRTPDASLASGCAYQLRLLEQCASAARPPHVVFTSSRLVYGKPARTPVDEDHPLAPESFYAAHKLTAEQYHRLFAARGAITYSICRISNPYGPDARENPPQGYGFLNQLLRRGVDGQPLPVFGDGAQRRDYIHIDDLVDALLLCAERSEARNEVFNIGAGAGVSIREAAKAVSSATGARIEQREWDASYRAVETGDFWNDIGKARRLLGFEPKRGFAEGIASTAAELRGRNSGPVYSNSMAYLQPADLVRVWFERVWNQGDLAVIDDLIAPQGVAHGLPGGADIVGPAQFKAFTTAFRGAVPDIHIEVVRTVVEGSFCATQCVVNGTHLGDTLGVRATGRAIGFEGMTLVRVENGQIQEGWNFFDFLGFYQQIGALPELGGAE